MLLLDEPPVVSALGNGLEGDVNRHYNNDCGDEEQPIETEGHSEYLEGTGGDNINKVWDEQSGQYWLDRSSHSLGQGMDVTLHPETGSLLNICRLNFSIRNDSSRKHTHDQRQHDAGSDYDR